MIQSDTVCFTGHRKLIHSKKVVQQKLFSSILPLIQQGYTCYQVGMALGFDLLAAESILELKKQFPLQLLAVLPCPPEEQIKGWSDIEKSQYYSILSKADKVSIVSPKYRPGCMFKRNRTLIDTSAVCIAYMYQRTGGTVYTVAYARNANMPILFI